MADAALDVVGFDRTAGGFDRLDELVERARVALAGEGVRRGRLDLVVVDPDEMAELNEQHLGHEGPTDVLSFPLDDPDDDLGLDLGPGTAVGPAPDASPPAAGGPPVHLGDVIICPEVAARQAPGHCGPVEAELALLVVHGVLHVLGHDHAEPDETARMQARERFHLRAWGFEHPVPAEPAGRS